MPPAALGDHARARGGPELEVDTSVVRPRTATSAALLGRPHRRCVGDARDRQPARRRRPAADAVDGSCRPPTTPAATTTSPPSPSASAGASPATSAPRRRPRDRPERDLRTRSPRPTPCRPSGCRRSRRPAARRERAEPRRRRRGGCIVALLDLRRRARRAARSPARSPACAGRTSWASTRPPARSRSSRACRSTRQRRTTCTGSSRAARCWPPRRCRAPSARSCSTTRCARRRDADRILRQLQSPSPECSRVCTRRATASSSTSLLPRACSPSAGFTAVLVARSGAISSTSLVYAGAFLGALRSSRTSRCASGCRRPTPTCCRSSGILASVGLCEIYRISPALARDQALWMAIGVAVFVAVLVLLPRLPRARALPLPARRARARPARGHDPLLVRHAHGDQRRARLDPRRRPLVPAGRARQDLPRAVPGRLPARAARAAGPDADARRSASACRRCASSRRCSACSAPRSAARRDERLRHVAALLRRLRGARLRRHRPRRLRGDRPRRLRRRQRRRLPRSSPHVAERVLDLARPVEDRRRRAATRSCSRSTPWPTAGSSARASAGLHPHRQRPLDHPRGADRLHLLGDRRRARASPAPRRCCSVTC